MKNIIYKEFKLAVYPAAFLFLLLAAMLIIPNYPSIVGMSYFILCIQITFSTAKENRDGEFTSMIPVTKEHLVFGKQITVLAFQLGTVMMAVPFALLSALVVNKSGNAVFLDANFAFFGLIFVYYAVFNLIFFPLYFKTGYKILVPILSALLAYLILVTTFELLIGYVPVLKNSLDSLSPSTFKYQLPVLFFGMVFYAATSVLTYRLSVKNYKKVNL